MKSAKDSCRRLMVFSDRDEDRRDISVIEVEMNLGRCPIWAEEFNFVGCC